MLYVLPRYVALSQNSPKQSRYTGSIPVIALNCRQITLFAPEAWGTIACFPKAACTA
jgi:hypothetical protein